MKTYFKKNKKNSESGIALIMAMTTVMLMTLLLHTFSYDTELNKIKIYNYQDRSKAKLNAEAGIAFAMSKLRLYQEARNTLEKNAAIKNVLSENKLQSMIIEPLIIPPPIKSDANIIIKTAMEKFSNSSVIDGNIAVTITPISGLININSLRFPVPSEDDENSSTTSNDDDDEDGGSSSTETTQTKAEKQKEVADGLQKELVKILTTAIEDKKEEDKNYEIIFNDVEPELLVEELRFYITPEAEYSGDRGDEIKSLYDEKELTPKYAPMVSLTEMHSLAGWSDELIDLVISRLTVHEASIIGVNEVTEAQMKMIFPDITDEQLDSFFKYRDGDPTGDPESEDDETSPHEFKTTEEFKTAITTKLNIVEEGQYDERIEELEKAGLKIGIASKLFLVQARGEKLDASYEISAIVDIPIKEVEEEIKKTGTTTPSDGNSSSGTSDSNSSSSGSSSDSDSDKDKDKDKPLEFLPPRILEYTVN